MDTPRAVLFGLISLACQSRVPEPEGGKSTLLEPVPSASESAAPAASPAPPAPPVVVTELKKEDQAPGTGPASKLGDTVKVHYTGKLMNGTKFDSSRDRGDPFQFTLGQGMVIKGWDEGVVGMKKGGKRKLTIPADKAYGPVGSPPKIPANAALVFEIELVEIVGG